MICGCSPDCDLEPDTFDDLLRHLNGMERSYTFQQAKDVIRDLRSCSDLRICGIDDGSHYTCSQLYILQQLGYDAETIRGDSDV